MSLWKWAVAALLLISAAPAALSQSGSPTSRAPVSLTPREMGTPTYDCAKASTAADRLICADAELARLDGELGAALRTRKAQVATAGQADFAAAQLNWIRDRNLRCGLSGKIDASDELLAASKSCMLRAIQERIHFLSSIAKPSSAGAPLHLSAAPSSEPSQMTHAPLSTSGFMTESALRFDNKQVAGSLDKRNRALAALENIAENTANGDSQQILAELNSMRTTYPDASNTLDVATCAASARKGGNTSAVRILQNECAREYRDWFSTCSQMERPKGCALTALLMTKGAIEGYDQHCATGSAQEHARFECGKIKALRHMELAPADNSLAYPSYFAAVALGIVIIGAILVGFIRSRGFRNFIAAALFITFLVWALSKNDANNDRSAMNLASDNKSTETAQQRASDFENDYGILQDSGKKLVAAGVLKYEISDGKSSLDVTLRDPSTPLASLIINNACDHTMDLRGEWIIRVYLVDGELADQCKFKRGLYGNLGNIKNAMVSMEAELRDKPWKEGFLRALGVTPRTGSMPPLSPAETRCRRTVERVSRESLEAWQQGLERCVADLRQDWVASHAGGSP